MDDSSERLPSSRPCVVRDELSHLIDGGHAAQITVALRLAPREQAMAAEHDAVASGRIRDGTPQHQRELEARTLPGHPHDAPAVACVELVEPGPAVGTGREGDRPVRVQVIDVRRRQKRVERRVDRRSHAPGTEGAHRVQVHHRVLVSLATVAIDQLFEPVEIEQRKSRARDRAQVTTAALHRQHACGLSRERVRQIDLRAGIPAAEVRNPQIRAEHVAPISEQVKRIGLERRRVARVPEVGKKTQCHRVTPQKMRVRDCARSEDASYRSNLRPRPVRAGQVLRGVDERHVGEGLRKIAEEMCSRWVVLLREEPDVVGERHQPFEQPGGLLNPSLQHVVVGQPERACEKHTFAGGQPVDMSVGRRAIPQHEAVSDQLPFDGRDRAEHPRVVCRKETDERQHQQAGVQRV